jgi:uncharacterized protein (TIGR03437 family)
MARPFQKLTLSALASLFLLTSVPGAAQIFTPTGSLTTARQNHTATLLPNGQVLIAGGVNGNTTLSSAELYNPATGVFAETGSMIAARSDHTATLLNNGMVLVTGGNTGSGYLSEAELYNPATGTFTATSGNLTTARAGHTATLLNNGMILIAGGAVANAVVVPSIDLYNPATGTFTATGNMVTPRYGHQATLLTSGLVLLAGGFPGGSGVSFLQSAELYNPTSGTFAATGNMTTPRGSHTMTLLPDGEVLVAGGYSTTLQGYNLSSAELYNPATGTFTATGSMVTAEGNHTATLLNSGQVLKAGGQLIGGGAVAAYASAELYNPAAGVFTPTASMNTSRATYTATLLGNGSVLIAGGYNTSTLASAELYQPESPPQVSLQPATLAFQAILGGAAPASQSVTIDSSGGSPVPWASQTSESDGGNWLSAAPTNGMTPGTVFVGVNPGNLAVGTYQGAVTISTALGTPVSQTIPVSLTVGGAPATLSLSSSALTFSMIVGQSPAAQNVTVGNTGSVPLSWRANAVVQSPAGGNWLSASPSTGASSASAPGALVITANTTGLPAGVYSGTVTVTNLTNPQSQTIAVTLIVSSLNETLVVSQTGLTFVGVQGGSSIPSQSFGVLNTGSGGSSMNWSLTSNTQSGGAWLSVTPTNGSSIAASPTALPTIPPVTVSVNVSGLQAGQYYGSITVNAPGASNGTQLVTVVLQVLPVGQNPGPIVRPTGLIFVAPAGGAASNPQPVGLYTALGEFVTANISTNTKDGGTWLSTSLLTDSFMAGFPGSFSTAVSPRNLAPSSTPYRGALVLYFSDGSLQTVAITFLVIPSSRVASDGGTAACVPTGLLLTGTSSGGGSYEISVGYPAQVQAQVQDDCGNPLPSQADLQTAVVIAAPQNGDPPFALNPIGNGLYESSYTTSTAGASTLTITATAGTLGSAQTGLSLGVQANPGQPTMNSGGIVNAASYLSGTPLAPGSIVSVFGSNLATQAGGATMIPLPQNLNGAKLLIDGNPTALFYAANGQVNAQLPFELPSSGQAQVLLSAPLGSEQAYTVPQTFVVGAAQPGIFSVNSSGAGQGVIVNNPANQIVSSTAPATAGDVVTVYCTGLGPTSPQAPATGTATPAGLFNATVPVTATIGGINAPVQFSGLTPGLVGLYQVNVQIPSGVTPGSAVPITITQNGVVSNTVTLAVH